MAAFTNRAFVKILVLSCLLYLESLLVVVLFYNFSLSQNYFSPDLPTFLPIFGLLLLIAYTYSLTAGTWHTNLQYLVVPLPISLGVFTVFATLNVVYATIIAGCIYLLVSYDVHFATKLSDELVNFNPNIVLRFSIRGVLFIFAIVAAIFILLNPAAAHSYDIAKSIAEVASTQMASLASQDPETSMVVSNLTLFGIDTKEIIRNKVDTVINPYRQYIVPILALATLGLIQFINVLVYLVFSITIRPIYALAKKSGFLKQEFVQVQKEVLRF